MRYECEVCKGPLFSYLGHFGEEKNLRRGHNDIGDPSDAIGAPNALDPSMSPTAYLLETIGGTGFGSGSSGSY